MADQQPAEPPGDKNKARSGRGAELTKLGGSGGAIILGLVLILGAVNNQPVTLSNQVVPEVPAPGGPVPRFLVGGVGFVLLAVGLAGLLNLERRVHELRAWRNRRRAPKPPQEPGLNVGRPPDRNPLFADRKEELDRLAKRLAKDQHVDLSGLGGVGKSLLAVEYLHRHRRAQYSEGVFWLRGETAATLSGDFAALAWLPQLELQARHLPEQERVVAAVTDWLRDREHWLLVIDNLGEKVIPTLNGLLARGLAGHVLVTSRVPVWPRPLTLSAMPLKEATDFLLDRTRQADRDAAAAIAQTLGGLPLALEQAGAYIELNSDLSSYARLLHSHLGRLMQEGKPPDYPFTVASTWNLSFAQIQRNQPASAALLCLCAFLAPDNIPISLMRPGAAGDQSGFEKAIGTLRTYSLVALQGDGLAVHRLVQWVVRESLPADQKQHWLAAVVRLLTAAFPREAEDPEHWPMCARLLPHVQIVVDLVGDQPIEQRSLGWLLDRAATYLQSRGEFALARPLYDRALVIHEHVLGPDDSNTAATLNNLARLLQNQGDLAAARPLLERALAIRERVLDPDHPDTAASLDNLANLLLQQGELAAARPLLERALAINEKVLGPDHPDTATSLDNLAQLLWQQGDLAAARPLLERALAINERVLGPEHPYTTTTLSNLARLLQDQGELDAARPLLERALTIRERVLGPDHPKTAISMSNLAGLLYQQGELAAARPLYERALAINEKVLGREHPDTASSLNNLGRLQRSQ